MNLYQIIKDAKRIGIAGHVKPDGDCTGSCLGLFHYIQTHFKKEVHVFLEPIPAVFDFLANSDRIEDAKDYTGANFDIFFALDCGDTDRLGAAKELFLKADYTICIDHHISNQAFADENYIYPHASSTSELVFELIDDEHLSLSKELAECLYVGIVHDTGVFQYSSTSSQTMAIAGKLMDTGIDFSKIVDDTFYSRTYIQTQILGQALLKSQLRLNNQIIVSTISLDDLEQFQATSQDLEGIVAQLRLTKNTAVAIFLYETANNVFKVSLRSNHLVNVSKVAENFGGGGHLKAAGATMEGKPEDVLKAVIDKIVEQTGWQENK